MRGLGVFLAVLILTASTAQAAPTITEPYTLTKPGSGVVTGPDGALWVSQPGRPGSISRVAPGGGLVEYVAEQTPGFTKDRAPMGMAVGADGALWSSTTRAKVTSRGSRSAAWSASSGL